MQGASWHEPLLWELGHKNPSTRNPTLNPQEVYRLFATGTHVSLGKTIETQETQGTLEGSRVFLGMSPHCMSGRGNGEEERQQDRA